MEEGMEESKLAVEGEVVPLPLSDSVFLSGRVSPSVSDSTGGEVEDERFRLKLAVEEASLDMCKLV